MALCFKFWFQSVHLYMQKCNLLSCVDLIFWNLAELIYSNFFVYVNFLGFFLMQTTKPSANSNSSISSFSICKPFLLPYCSGQNFSYVEEEWSEQIPSPCLIFHYKCVVVGQSRSPLPVCLFTVSVSSQAFVNALYCVKWFFSIPSFCARMLNSSACLTLCGSMDCKLPGSPVHGIPRARVLEWVAISFSRGSL